MHRKWSTKDSRGMFPFLQCPYSLNKVITFRYVGVVVFIGMAFLGRNLWTPCLMVIFMVSLKMVSNALLMYAHSASVMHVCRFYLSNKKILL